MAARAPLSFRTRLTVRWTLVFSCVLASASVAIYFGIRSASYADLDRHLRTLAGTEVASAFDQPISPHVHEVPTTVLAGGTFTEKLVQVFGVDGRLIVSSRGRAEDQRLVPRDVIEAGLAGHAPTTTVHGGGAPIRVLVLRQMHEGTDYIFVVGVVITEFLNSLARVKWLLVVVWLVSTLATAAVGFALASTALEPVRHITERAMHIAEADIRGRLEAPALDDEIGRMARSLNVLLERLQGALDVNRRFAADAAHELRSPVTAMAGEIDVALRRERTAAEYRETLALVRDRLSSLSAVISDLMLLVRAQEGHGTISRHELSLETLIEGSVARQRPMANARGVSIIVENLTGLWMYGDAGLLGRAFDNVLENAIRYNRENGTVRIQATFVESEPDSWKPSRVILRIIDTGPGIPSSDVERVFQRFYRVDASRNRHTGGAGLGLAIAREVLAAFQGSIRIESSSADGTAVVISLPGRQHKEQTPRGQPVFSSHTHSS